MIGTSPGNRMSPTHSNKFGVRYRYYVSHAILQNRRVEAGSIARVPASEIISILLGLCNQPRILDPRPRLAPIESEIIQRSGRETCA
jgi:site-specific DNA recombinase